jgi:hypothetical protein
MWWRVTLVVMAASTASAAADSDNRPQDRFAFSLSLNSATNGSSAGVGTPVNPITGIAWETSYWPNDYVGVAYDFELVQVPDASQVSMRTSRGSTNTGFGTAAFIAIPLRYVQPYAGVWAGIRYNFVDGDSFGGANRMLAPRAGLNVYMNRNLRLFGQWESIELEENDYEGRVANVVSFGVRWSPDVFHRQRPVTKFTAVWTFLVMSFGLWATTSAIAGN